MSTHVIMYTRVKVCVYVSVCIKMYAYVHLHIYLCVHMCMHCVWLYVSMWMCTFVYVHTHRVHANMSLCTMSARDYVTALCMWVFVGISMYTHIYVYSYCVSMYTWMNVHYVCTCEHVSLLCMCMSLCICVFMWVYVAICVFACICVSGKRLTAQLSLLVWPVASCRVINEKGEKQSVFSACIFPFFVFIKRWLLILEVEHCHKKPFAVNKAVAAAWGVNRRPGKPCENHLSAAFTKWVRRKGKMGHPGSSILVPHTGQGSPLPAGMGVTCGCAQLLGYRPTVCTAVREQPSLSAAVKTLAKLSGRLGQFVPGPEDCSPQAWPHSSYEDISATAPPHPG